MKIVETGFGKWKKGGQFYKIAPSAGQTLAQMRAEAEAAGYSLVTPSALEKAAMLKKREIASARYDAEFAGFTDPASGLFIRTDERTRSLLTAAKLRAQANAAYLVENWKTADGSFITLDAPTIIALEAAVHDFIEAQFAKEAALVTQIDSATTTQEVNAITW
ncbi:DUF4376 domain-containing protein [Tichowtungia aerotolerans]|uniref:DUF4376 domain-containing protein n=1 Tax=Tichowtungia aerotolerans TaxID=2697043 RepID=A0A6P1M7M9_9BACT|nr:DUF4376 domain-containing protein [Tichowtungia aerotolerans]QHI69871.1 DUF4376 domain-containing protein [Tichowtungia aerotolerans]